MIIGKPYFAAALALGIAAVSASAPAFAQTSQATNQGAGQADAQFELAFWQAVATSDDKAQYEAYLAKYPNGTFSALAALKIAALGRGTAGPSPSVSSPPSSSSSAGSSAEPSMEGGASMGSSGMGGSSGSESSMDSGSSSSNFSGSQEGSSSMGDSSSSSSVQETSAGQPASTKKQLLGAAFSLGAALMANRQKKAAKQGISSSSGGSGADASSSGSSQPKSGTQAILGQLLPVANGLTGGKLGGGNQGSSDRQQGGTTAMLVSTALQLVMPNRPSLSQADAPNLPSGFCSADARNAFYEAVFKPAMAKADQNNDDSIAYMQVLQQLFDAAGAKSDNAKMSSVSSESRAFSSIASQTQKTRLSFNGLFSQLMAVPLGKC